MIRSLPETTVRSLQKDFSFWLADLIRYLDEAKGGLGVHQCARTKFTVSGGMKLTGIYTTEILLPINAIVIRSWYDVTNTFRSATDAATIAIGIAVDDTVGIVAATAISAVGDVWDNGYHEGIQTGTAATASEKTTADRRVQVTIGAENLTAGEFVLFIEYVASEVG